MMLLCNIMDLEMHKQIYFNQFTRSNNQQRDMFYPQFLIELETERQYSQYNNVPQQYSAHCITFIIKTLVPKATCNIRLYKKYVFHIFMLVWTSVIWRAGGWTLPFQYWSGYNTASGADPGSAHLTLFIEAIRLFRKLKQNRGQFLGEHQQPGRGTHIGGGSVPLRLEKSSPWCEVEALSLETWICTVQREAVVTSNSMREQFY